MLVDILITVFIIILLISFLIFIFVSTKKNKQKDIKAFNEDLIFVSNNYHLNKKNLKDLPVFLEDEQLKDRIYLHARSTICDYESPKKIVNSKNAEISQNSNLKFKVFYHYPLVNLFNRIKFKPLNQIDLLISDEKIYFLDPLEPFAVEMKKIKEITFFWEKNFIFKKSKDYLPALTFKYEGKNYFMIFKNYNDILSILACINSLI